MRAALIVAIIVALTASAGAQELADPFVNQLKLKEKASGVKKRPSFTGFSIPKSKSKRKNKKVKLFSSKLPQPLELLKIDGVIEAGGVRLLVVTDPETGQTFFLKEGDAVSESEKIGEILPDRVVIYRYKNLNGHLKKEVVTLKVDMEG